MEKQSDILVQVVANHPMNPSKTDEYQYSRRVSIIRDFALNTTTHGIPGIARSRTLANRIFWSLAFLGFASAMLYFIIQALRAYFEYPTQTTVYISSERVHNFPAFTICNAGIVRADALRGPVSGYALLMNITEPSDEDCSRNREEFFKYYFSKIINENGTIDQYIFKLDTMLLECHFVGEDCTVENFTEFDSAAYGRCYTFNAKTRNDTVRRNHDTDYSGKLSLRLYLHAHQYPRCIAEGVAMMAMVHDNTELPLIERGSLALAPGFRHRLTYTKRHIVFTPPPYSKCTSDIPPVMKFMFDKYAGTEYAYSEDLCQILCAQAYIYEQCQCVNPAQWNARCIILPGTNSPIMAPLCNGSDECFKRAISNFDLSLSIRDQYCSYCLTQCSITDFYVQASAAHGPRDWLLPSIKAFVENTSISLPHDWYDRWPEHIASSYLSIELLAESSLSETYKEVPAMKSVELMSSVGGQTGLWIGISFLSLMEFFEMIYRLIKYQFRTSQSVSNNDNMSSKTI